MQKTLGGDRLGSGNRMKVELHNYERSTHDLSYVWRSTMSAGTLVPFLTEIALPGDTFDITLNMDGKTHPTIGPLFGSYKAQLDVFQCPIRLYNSLLHNNALGIGLKMANVKLPIITMTAPVAPTGGYESLPDLDNSQINPSCLLSYLGIRGIGINGTGAPVPRTFHALGILGYWDIYKQYYSNKMEEIGAVIHVINQPLVNTITTIEITSPTEPAAELFQAPLVSSILARNGSLIEINYTGTTPIADQILFNTNKGQLSLTALIESGTGTLNDTGTQLWGHFNEGIIIFQNWNYADGTQLAQGQPQISTFPLSNIDDMRNAILHYTTPLVPFDINVPDIVPYTWLAAQPDGIPNALSSQEGLGLKTYQSDLFNNWLNTEWIDGTGGINEITAIDTTGGSFTIDTLNLSNKVYKMLNRIMVSGGTYDDWLDAVYTEDRYKRCETPMYMGGLIKELIFQEVVSNSASETTNGTQELGTLAGKGTMAQKHKGGNVVIKVDEPSYLIGIVSLTPRIDYSQGNKWDIHLQTLDDLHKPALDEIGFQELQAEQLAWWDTISTGTGEWLTHSAGKQPAWLNYMTNVNRVYGNFAIGTQNLVGEMFMVLNRRYEYADAVGTTSQIKDLTTYIDPSKYNFIFAETALDAQNFWVQISVDMIARRKMSAKLMPNL